jgi:hypothetical protein
MKKTINLPSSITAGSYVLKVDGKYDSGEEFTHSLTGLTVPAPENKEKVIFDPATDVAVVAPANKESPVQFTTVDMGFQLPAEGPVVLSIIDPGPPPHIEVTRTFPNMVPGMNRVSLELVSPTGNRLHKGIYEWILIYKGQKYTGIILVPH